MKVVEGGGGVVNNQAKGLGSVTSLTARSTVELGSGQNVEKSKVVGISKIPVEYLGRPGLR